MADKSKFNKSWFLLFGQSAFIENFFKIFVGFYMVTVFFIVKGIFKHIFSEFIAKETYTMEKDVYITALDGKNSQSIALEDISYISIVKHGCRVHILPDVLKEGKYGSEPEKGFFIKESLNSIHNKISQLGFGRPHQSYIVNMGQIHSIDIAEQILILKSGEILKISRSRKTEFQQLLFLHSQSKNTQISVAVINAAKEKIKYYEGLEKENRQYRKIFTELKRNITYMELMYHQSDIQDKRNMLKQLKEIVEQAEEKKENEGVI